MNQYLSFDINSKLYLFNISQVHSIIKKQVNDIRPLPESPPFFVGLTQLRESTIGVMCASALFDNKRLTVKDEYDVIIVKTSNEELYGIIVDIVHGVKNIEPEQLTENTMMGQLNPYILKVYNDSENLHLLVDVNRLVEIKNFKEVENENKK